MVGPPRDEVRIRDGMGGELRLRLARDERGRIIFRTETLRQIQPTVQVGEATYASYQPEKSAVYVQVDLSGGVGSKVQKPGTDADATRSYYAEWMDTSVEGQIQKGPAVTTVTAPANSGTLSGTFVLGGTRYLCLGRILASYSAGALTQVRDLGVGDINGQAATFAKLAAESSIETNTGDTATTTVTTSDARVAQQFRVDDTGVKFLSRVDAKLIAVNPSSITGDVRLAIHADLNGRPSGTAIVSARMLAANISTSATVYTFRFDDDEALALSSQDTYWLVLDATGVTATNTMGWRGGTDSAYARGSSATSSDGGNTWTASATADLYFDIYAKVPTATAFVGSDDTTNPFATTTDGTNYTDITNRTAAILCRVADRLVRDVRATGARGCIEWSTDGTNWSEPIPIGDPTTQITALLAINGDILLVCKTDSVSAVDITSPTALSTLPDVQELVYSPPVTSNGVGSAAWLGTGYVPWLGGLMAVSGDFDAGFDVEDDCSMRVLPEWDFPHGAGRIVAVAHDRFHLYAILSATGGYRVYKAADPVNKRDWHGSLCTIGDGTQTVNMAVVDDPGGTSNPHLLVTTTSNDVADIVLPRTKNPANDSSYLYDITTAGDLYYPYATGGFAVNPKAWLAETMTFLRTGSGDYVDVLYDDLDGTGWRRPKDRGGRLFDTGVIRYPANRASRLFGRRLRIVNSAQTTCPIVVASGLSYTVRPIGGTPLRDVFFAVEAEDDLSALDLGEQLGLTAETITAGLEAATAAGGTRYLETPTGQTLPVVITRVRDTLLGAGERTRAIVEVEATQVG